MAFFQELGKKIGEVAQDAQKKTAELIEINKLNGSIKDEKEAIDTLYRKIGMNLYARFAAGETVEESAIPDLEAIANRLRTIMSLEAKIVDLKKDDEKPAANQPPAAAPAAWSAPVETPAPPAVDEELTRSHEPVLEDTIPNPPSPPEPPVAAPRFCTGCGTPLVPGAVFCGNCGNRVG